SAHRRPLELRAPARAVESRPRIVGAGPPSPDTGRSRRRGDGEEAQWARPDSNRRSSLCESDVVTTGPRAQHPSRRAALLKGFYIGRARTNGTTRLATTVRTRPLARARLPASRSP